MKKITEEDLKGKELAEIIVVLLHKIDELVDAVNKHTKQVEIPPYQFTGLDVDTTIYPKWNTERTGEWCPACGAWKTYGVADNHNCTGYKITC